jgi:hypothetical protein
MSESAKSLSQKSIDYSLLEKEKLQQIQHSISHRLANQSLGKIDSLRHTILSHVVRGEYETAVNDLDRYVMLKSAFPSFFSRTESHFQHSKELINAIRAKRNFKGLSSMTMSKQQEMLDNVLGHFEELKVVLKYIERIAKDCALEDLRSTAWLLKTTTYVVMVVVATAFLMDFSGALGRPLVVVYNDFANTLWSAVTNSLGW